MLQMLDLKLSPYVLAQYLPFHIMVIMVLVGIIRNAHWEKFGRHETIRAKCFYNVNRFEFSCSFETVFGDVFCT